MSISRNVGKRRSHPKSGRWNRGSRPASRKRNKSRGVGSYRSTPIGPIFISICLPPDKETFETKTTLLGATPSKTFGNELIKIGPIFYNDRADLGTKLQQIAKTYMVDEW